MAVSSTNPFTRIITDSENNTAKIQHLYACFRAEHTARSRQALLSPDFSGLLIDEHLVNLERRPGFRDGRHCLVFWARPPIHTLRLAEELQRRLRLVAPNAWMMPTYRMHLTTLEIAFSKTADEIASLVAQVRPEAERITSYTYSHRARLVKPAVTYDLKGFAVSWVTAAGETAATSNEDGHVDDAFTYHHLRRDVYDLVQETGVKVASRLQVPGAHVTLGRFLDHGHHDTVEKRQTWAAAVDNVNRWLEAEVWGTPDGEWIVGQEKGLDFRAGTLWYGGGRTIIMGEGF
ncbi:ureidoglycolate hydrolase [Ophiocordyceps camponoti-floridani]|uniref:Ureidoglycolate hydrolase n=1 Tax=Ophiocordyceps camponoti-floridani TaxID=2030778 RepID=A0A8H4Q3G1_9HYPO|nr:ureidoglycolate hydrolase [Ophiocordyceps camponoti-floridani]